MWLARLAVPFRVGVHVPLECLVVVAAALTARVRHAQRLTEVRPRHAQAVVRTVVDHHVRLFGHVALDAQRPVARLAVDDLLMEVMCRGVIGAGLMTLRAESIAFLVQCKAVCIVAITALDADLVHLALHE